MGDDIFDPGTFESSYETAFEAPEFSPADPDAGLEILPRDPFMSKSDVLRDIDAGVLPGGLYPATPSSAVSAAQSSNGFDWSQIGDTFTRVGAALTPIIQTGADIAAVATGRPTSAQRAQQASQSQRNTMLLYLAGGGVILLFLLRRKGRR